MSKVVQKPRRRNPFCFPVRAYERFRYGKLEKVCAHKRCLA